MLDEITGSADTNDSTPMLLIYSIDDASEYMMYLDTIWIPVWDPQRSSKVFDFVRVQIVELVPGSCVHCYSLHFSEPSVASRDRCITKHGVFASRQGMLNSM